MVSDPRQEWRAEGLRGLALGAGSGVTEEIASYLSDPSDLVRAAAAESLGQGRDPQALEVLIEALGDDSPAVREAAATSVVTLDADPSERLVEALAAPALEEGALLAARKMEFPPSGLQEYGARQVDAADFLARMQARLPETPDARIRLLHLFSIGHAVTPPERLGRWGPLKAWTWLRPWNRWSLAARMR
jgi:hypothetical protein